MAEEVKTEGNTESTASSNRQRKKRKWDQPAESVIAATAATPGIGPFSNGGALSGMTFPCMFPSLVGVYPTVPTPTASAQTSLVFPTVQQNAAAIVQKINQDLVAKGLVPPNKIQDELIAREIVINDAEPGIRYKLTKRQTQEEIQAKTGTVVITRGRYKPPIGPPDHEKPLYLHISAGAQLKTTTERVRAVDQAAAIIDEMLKQGRQVLGLSSAGQTTSPLSAVVFVDFEVDSSVDLISRIRGPNDQYINHIMTETGATLLLKGGSCEDACSEEIPQPLHLLITAEHTKSLDDARTLTEHLLETIRTEVTGSRPPYFPPPVSYNLQQLPVQSGLEPGTALSVSASQQPSFVIPGSQAYDAKSASFPLLDFNAGLGSSKTYSAVPPPKQLLTSDAGSVQNESSLHSSLDAAALASASPALTCSTAHAGHPAVSTAYTTPSFFPQLHGIYPQASRGSESSPSFSAYSGLYPQASPLQQVALAVQRTVLSQGYSSQAPPPLEPNVVGTQGQQAEKQERQRRKFQEGPGLRREPSSYQNKQGASSAGQIMPPPRFSALPLGSMLPPPSVSMPPPPPIGMPTPPLDTKPTTGTLVSVSMPIASIPSAPTKSTALPAAPTGFKLVEYGEDEEEEEEEDEYDGKDQLAGGDGKASELYANGKPFWAV